MRARLDAVARVALRAVIGYSARLSGGGRGQGGWLVAGVQPLMYSLISV
jgi:hypothetical protein